MTDKPLVKCGTCRHFKPFYPELREAHETDEDGTPGLCTAIKSDKLPYAWRYATREVMQSWSLTEIYCAAHESIPPTDAIRSAVGLNPAQAQARHPQSLWPRHESKAMTPITPAPAPVRAITRADVHISPVQAAVMRHVLYLIANAEFDPNELTPLEFGVGLQEMALSVLLATTPREAVQ